MQLNFCWQIWSCTTHTHTHPFNSPFSGTTQVSRYQKGKTNLDFTEARDSEWQWHQLGHMQVCTSLQTDNHASTPPHHSVFLQAGCPSCCPTKSVLTNTGNKYFSHLSCKMRQILYKKYQFMWPVIVTEVWHNLICVEKMPLNFNWWILSCSKVLEK